MANEEKTPLKSVQSLNSEADEKLADSNVGPKATLKRGIYLLPNVITTGALFAGFYAIVAAMNGQFLAATIAIFFAMILDTVDGRVARIMGTESEFGAEYDSLSDMVAFGVAPALVAFSWGLSQLGQFGWVAAFVYMACAALRLARFNTVGETASFTGLASPSAAGIICFGIWVCVTNGISQPSFSGSAILAVATVMAGLLMVSNFTYFSPKTINIRERIPFVTLVLIVMGFAILMIDPPSVLLTICICYSLSGPLKALWDRLKPNQYSNDID
jgi:CDP-diacylglycerol--serine O-phosphatidyltransferase